MGIDLTRLRRKTDEDVVKKIVDDVFREEVDKPTKTEENVRENVVGDQADQKDQGNRMKPGIKVDGGTVKRELLPDGSLYIGDMYYKGQKVKVGDRVDDDGNTFVVDEGNNLWQVKAEDLKPNREWDFSSNALQLPEPEPVNATEQQTGFWHTYLGDWIERLGAGAADFSGSMYGLLDVVDNYALKYAVPGRALFEAFERRKFEKEHPGQPYKSWLARQEEKTRNYAQTLRERSNRYGGKDFEQLFDEGRYGEMVGDVFLTASESAPQSVVAMAGGPAGLALTGAAAGRQKYYQLDRMPEAKDMPEAMKVFNSVATGTFEALSEKLGDVQIGKYLKQLYKTGGKEVVERAVKEEASNVMSEGFKRAGILFAPVAEGIEEVSSQVAENATDYITGLTGQWNPLEGGLHAFVYGMGGGAQFSGVGGAIMVRNQIGRFNARRDYRKAKKGVEAAFPEDKDVETFVNSLTYLSPAEQEAVIVNMAKSGNVTDEQLKAVADFAGKANVYQSYLTPEAKEKEREAVREQFIRSRMQQFDEIVSGISNESGKIQGVTLNGDRDAIPVYIVKGELAVTPNEQGGFELNVMKSSPELYYRDDEGSMQVISPANVQVVSYEEVASLRANYEKALREGVQAKTSRSESRPTSENSESRFTSESREKEVEEGNRVPTLDEEADTNVKIENGSDIVYVDEEGKQVRGVVADAFSSPEYVFLADGTAILKGKILGVVQEKEGNNAEEKAAPKEEVTIDRDAGTAKTAENGFEIEDGVFVREDEKGDYRLNVEYSKSELKKGQKLVDRLNSDYEDEGIRFELVNRGDGDGRNPLVSPTDGLKERKKPLQRFAERDRALGDYVSIRDEILRGIATGRFRFAWNDQDIRRGISKELGFTEKEKERRRRFWMFDNTGYSVDGLAHQLSEASDSPGYHKDTEEIRNEIIEVMNTYDTPTAMLEAAEGMRADGEEARQRFFDNMTDEEREWYSQVLDLQEEFRREQKEEIPLELEEQFLAQGITLKELKELHSLDNFIKFEELRLDYGSSRSESEPAGNPAEMAGAKREGSVPAGVETAVGSSENTGGSEEATVPTEMLGYDVLKEKKIRNDVNSGVDKQISRLRQRLKEKKQELKEKKQAIGGAYSEDKQLSLFGEEEGQGKQEELFGVDRDFSDKNIEAVLSPIQREIRGLEEEIRGLERQRGKAVKEAVEAERRQGKLFGDEVTEGKRGISREEIEAIEADEQMKDMALDYLNGEDHAANRLAYLSIKNKIENDRNRPKYSEQSREGREGGTFPDTQAVQFGLSEPGKGGGDVVPGNVADGRAGVGSISDDGTGQGVGGTDDNGARDRGRADEFSDRDGEPGLGSVSGITPGGNEDGVDSMHAGRGRRRPGDGKERATSPRREEGDSRGDEKVTEGRADSEQDRKADLEAELDAALSDFNAILSKFKSAGRKDLSISLAGLTNQQIEMIGEVVAAGAKVGYVLLKKGVYSFQEWAKALRQYIGGKLKECGLPDEDVEELIQSMWDAKVRDANGERKKISELAKAYGVAPADVKEGTPPPYTFQEQCRINLEKQRAAESIPVVVNDAENIRATLPMLLVEQRDDVVKAESRFFDQSKKGILFTNGTGTGKTYTGLGVIKRFVKQGRKDILIVVPSSEKVKDWSNDGRNLLLNIIPLKDTKDGGEGICVTTYANFRENEALKRRVFDLVVYDECHRIMESAGGDYSATTNTHFKMTNKSVFYAVERMLDCDEDYRHWKEIGASIRAIQEQIREVGNSNKKEPNVEKKVKVTPLKKQIRTLEQEMEEAEKLWRAKEPAMEEQAKKDVERTKVLFLSATPFKSVFNLRYADGYLFDFPEYNYVGYNVPTGENLFYIENFGAQFQMRYGRLETKGKDINPEAVSMQEIEFQKKLTREGAMSGRAIESNMDYSREFVKPSAENFNPELFNEALNAIWDFKDGRYMELWEATGKVFNNYQYTTRLMEALKTSMFIPRIEAHIRLGRKVVLFHRRKQANIAPPFASILSATRKSANLVLRDKNASPESVGKAKLALRQCDKFRHEFANLLLYENTLNYTSAIDQVVNHFGSKRVRLFNGDIGKKEKSIAVKEFNDDDSGVDIIMIQEESGKEGISLHDRTGKYQRVLISLSAPISSITALQIEGRIYRIGQASNAIFEYPTLGLDSELVLFSQNINRKLSTTENLALGDSARNLIKSFAEGIENWSEEEPREDQGTGGKEADLRQKSIKGDYEKAVLTYFTNQKKRGDRNSREGMDYFATPEPLGYKLVEWTGIRTGEWLLEPSAGHGAIAMWVPANCGVTAIEPSYRLFARLGGKVANGNAKVLNTTFEEHDLVNKYDVVAMNPPFGVGGATAMSHIEKAFKHLRKGGRLVAIVPNGGNMNKRLEKFLYGEDSKGKALNPDALLVGEVVLPGCTFEQAGTTVYCRVIIIDKVGKGVEFNGESKRLELNYCKDVKELFDQLEYVTMPARPKVVEEEVKEEKSGVHPDDGELVSEVRQTQHTKTKADLFVVKLNRRVEGNEFKRIAGIAEQNNGYRSRYLKAFVFNSREEAEKFRAQVHSGQEEVRYRQKRVLTPSVFFSNAAYAVKSVQQERATPEQWLGMLQKNGGLKAGEDEWLSLSDWLKTCDQKSVTKQEVLDFIAANEVEVEETELQEDHIPYKPWNVLDRKVDFGLYVSFRKGIAEGLARRYAEDDYGILTDRILEGKAYVEEFQRALKDVKVLKQGVLEVLWSFDYGLYGTEKGVFSSLEAAVESLDNVISDIRLKFTTEGLKDKRELVLSVPGIEKWEKRDTIHFGRISDGKAVVWVRFGETRDEKGKRVLVIDEIQSKRHQTGRKYGYLKDFELQFADRPEAPYIRRHIETERMYRNEDISAVEAAQRDEQLRKEIREAGLDEVRIMSLASVGVEEYKKHYNPPTAPFGKNWQELGLKRMLRYAAEQGYDRLAWTKGEQQAGRYDLGNAVDAIEGLKNEGGYTVYGWVSSNESRILGLGMNEKELQELLGESLAKQVFESKETYGMISGEGLRVGFSGMSSFYDQILVDFMNKYGKKWGVKVEEVVLPEVEGAGHRMWGVEVTPEMKESVMKGQPLFRQSKEEVYRKGKVLEEIERLEKGLGVRINVVGSREELPDALKKGMSGEVRYPGLYSVRTGEVYVVLDEITDEEDAQRTVLHEVVGHKGLRGLLGERFGEFTEEVLRSMKEEERAAWVRNYGGDRQLAAEEFVASFAEEEREVSVWEKIKAAFRDALRHIGVRLRLSDNDLKYLLWKGANRLKGKETALDAIDKKTKDYAMYREVEEEKFEVSGKVDISNEEKLKFHQEIVSRRFKFVEAYQDRMLAVKKLQELLEAKIGKKLPFYMNCYFFENTLASRNTYEIEHFRRNELKRMTDVIAVLEEAGLSSRELENYVICKHGLERNAYIRQKKVEQWYRPQAEELERQRGKTMSEARYQRELLLLNEEKKFKEARLEKMDFSGLKAVEGELKGGNVDAFIQRIENSYPEGVNELWAGIKACTDLSLRKWFESGMTNQKQYDRVRSMFKHYVPLRGFDETIASDVFEYFNSEGNGFNSPLRTAKGRRSRADSPFAYVVSLVESSIVGGNKNLMKLHLFRAAQKYPSDLMTVSRAWFREIGKDAEGNPLYETLLPIYDEDGERYRQNIAEFEKEMAELAAEEKVFKGREKLKVGYRLLDEEPQEHVVRCCLNGEPFHILIHGNPRAAQAIEGLNDEERIDHKVLNAIRWMNRQMAANFTTRNPAFVLSNMTRDLIFSVTTLSVKEGRKYRNRFVRNIYPASGAIRRYLQGKPEKGNRTDKLFEEFLKNGGETGYTALYNIEKFKKMIDQAVVETKRNRVAKAGMKVIDFFAAGNRWAEDLSRFSVYLTSREMGRPVLESVHDAKEVTVNFNKKGSGALGAQVFKGLYLFFNAAVQSMSNFYQLYRQNPKGACVMMSGYAVAGLIVPLLLSALGGEDAEEEYVTLPDYVRKNNLCVYLGKKRGFLTLPLPIELRAFFGIGDAAYRYFRGDINGLTASGETILGMMDVLPLSPSGNSAPFVPDAIKPIAQSYYLNEDFIGIPVAKVTPYNRYLPEFRRVYRGTSKYFVQSAEIMNYFSGGDYATRGYVDQAGKVVSDLLNMEVNVTNPGAAEHVVSEYLGGMYKTIMQTLKTGANLYEWARTGESSRIEARSFPILNRFYNRNNAFSRQSKINEAYYRCLDELKEYESRLRQYEEAAYNGRMGVETVIDRCSKLLDDGSQERADVIKYYSGEIGKISEGLGVAGLSDEDREELEQEELFLKRQMLETLEEVEKK